MYLPDGTDVCGSRGGEFEGIGSKVESCEIVLLGNTSYSLAQTCLLQLRCTV